MKFKFKIQSYQTAAVASVIDCFSGQSNLAGVLYPIDRGQNNTLQRNALQKGEERQTQELALEQYYFSNSDNSISRRQEVGRGLRISVNQYGDRTDNPATVHEINVLTVVASESYKEFVQNLQKEISESLSRPRKADEAYFTGKIMSTAIGEKVAITTDQAKGIEFYLIQNGYVDRNRQMLARYHEARADGTLAALPPELALYTEQVFGMIDSVFSASQLPEITDSSKQKSNRLNDNFYKKAFKELWKRINKKACYRVTFDSDELIRNAIQILNSKLCVSSLTYTIQRGEQTAEADYEQMQSGRAFVVKETRTTYGAAAGNSVVDAKVNYDLLGKIAANTQLTRKTIARILVGVRPEQFKQFTHNPEHFISESSRLINEQKATMIIERLSYNSVTETYDKDIWDC